MIYYQNNGGLRHVKIKKQPGQGYIGKTVELDQSIFNVPLRRDFVHSYFIWRQKRDKIQTHICRNKATTRGSGIKPQAQKGTGKARQGNKRSPHLKKGGKAFGPRPRILRQSLNKKVRLQALKVMLSAKLAEGKLRIIESEAVNEPKTRSIAKQLNKIDPYSRILIIHGYKPDRNFELAHRTIKKIDSAPPDVKKKKLQKHMIITIIQQQVSVQQLLQNDRIFITLEGLRQLTQELTDRTFRQFRLRHVERGILPSEQEKIKLFPIENQEQETKYTYDSSKPLQFKFKILQDYYQQYEKLKNSGEIQKFIEKK
ncbi:hypothetical protein IMG5_098230 [Ichthyophthirius multifiliis]|uniref:Large ribosomal subunit protein uL4m n=1 Tax=Ichthyophthirius multifiliis TaxID=5932 RepID=G0QRW7_ICHMU|nr:hypothetical protein IMG5_098230 [Ichthyophthirius multifiliis]EGR31997.1 hypothetical protein IMG5_098230 [Ichthyophthirius multifiliis]|eukprot:XP_004035483.1 hypothetical protein IMG5_098230 [Ichthyophthirius multifiliis]